MSPLLCFATRTYHNVWDLVTKTATITSRCILLHLKPHQVEICSCQWSTDVTSLTAQDLNQGFLFFFSDRFSSRLKKKNNPTGSEHRVLIFPAPFIIYCLSSYSSNLWFESISCRSFVLLVYLAPHAGLLVGLSWRWWCGFTVMSQSCYASTGRLPPPTDR